MVCFRIFFNDRTVRSLTFPGPLNSLPIDRTVRSSEMIMLQRTTGGEVSRLTLVPADERESAEAKPAPHPPDESESRGPLPQPTAAPSAKAAAIGALKANRKRILMGVAAVMLLGAGWLG